MKKVSIIVLSLGFLIGASTVVDAKAKVITYKNCTELNKVYKGGIAKTKTAKNTKIENGKKVLAKSKYKPFVSLEIYNANKKHDRDNDSISCEK